MLKITKILLKNIFIALVVILSSCNYDKRELPKPVAPLDSTLLGCDTASSVTYTNFVKTILETNCTSFSNCHGNDAPPGLDYTFYAGIKAKVDTGIFQIKVLNLPREMPSSLSPGPQSLDTCTLYRLQKWVNNGAPE